MDQQPPQSPNVVTPPPPLGQYGPYAPAPLRPPASAPPRPARLPKAQAIAITRRLKSGLIAGSVMSFGVLVALVAGHVTGATARQASSSAASGTSASATNPAPANSDDGGFFSQGSGSASNGGFGVSPNAPNQQPIGGSSVS